MINKTHHITFFNLHAKIKRQQLVQETLAATLNVPIPTKRELLVTELERKVTSPVLSPDEGLGEVVREVVPATILEN